MQELVEGMHIETNHPERAYFIAPYCCYIIQSELSRFLLLVVNGIEIVPVAG
jgi:hypothetical protein